MPQRKKGPSSKSRGRPRKARTKAVVVTEPAPEDAWKAELEEILHDVPGYNPWDQAGDAWVDHEAALHAINWFAEKLKHVEGSARGDPFILRRWQAAIVGNLFGWKRRDDAGRTVRRYRQALIYVPRGNGKTPLAAGIVLYAYFEDKEPGAQCYLAAGQREQAGILFRNAAGMVDQEPELSGLVKIYRGDQHRCMILEDDPLSFCKTIPADAAGQHGGIPHVTVVDELHVQENRELLDTFETAMSKKVRSQPLLVMITTADYDRESICNEVYAHACRVRDNGGDPERPGHDPAFLPVIYELGRDDEWGREELWGKANPNLDVSVSRESLQKIVKAAKETPAKENAVKRLHFNMRTGQDVRLVPMDKWDACHGIWLAGQPQLRDADSVACVRRLRELLKGKPCFGGLDLASTEDLASLSLTFPLEGDLEAVLTFSWCPEARVERRAKQKYPYDVWAKQGFLYSTPGDQIDYRAIRALLNELKTEFDIRQLGFDKHGATHLVQDLMELDGFKVVIVPQSFAWLAAPTKELIRLLKTDHLIHGGNPVLRWAATNAAPHFDGKIPEGQKLEDHLEKVPVMLSKRKSADKIDPLAATVIALACQMSNPNVNESRRSVYENRGIMFL